VHVHQLHSGHGRAGKHRTGDGVGDVVKFQVEEDFRTQLPQLPDRSRPFRSK
jgi:hypothetical protein